MGGAAAAGAAAGVTGPVGVPVALGAEGRGAVLGLATADLNVNEVAWPPGAGVHEHRNDLVDVLFVVVEGAMTVTLDGERHDVPHRHMIVIPKGAVRSVTAGPDGVRYVTCHRRRPPLGIT